MCALIRMISLRSVPEGERNICYWARSNNLAKVQEAVRSGVSPDFRDAQGHS